MYTVATCTATIYRRQSGKDEYGDPNGQYIPLYSGVQAAIQETTNTVMDYATQTPRAVRTISGLFPPTTDVQVLDRVRDDTYGITYVVDNVTLNRAPGHQPDLQVTLRKVTP